MLHIVLLFCRKVIVSVDWHFPLKSKRRSSSALPQQRRAKMALQQRLHEAKLLCCLQRMQRFALQKHSSYIWKKSVFCSRDILIQSPVNPLWYSQIGEIPIFCSPGDVPIWRLVIVRSPQPVSEWSGHLLGVWCPVMTGRELVDLLIPPMAYPKYSQNNPQIIPKYPQIIPGCIGVLLEFLLGNHWRPGSRHTVKPSFRSQEFSVWWREGKVPLAGGAL